MKFGLLLDPQTGPPQGMWQRLLRQAQAAGDWGFDSVWIEEEALAPGGQAAAIQAAAALAASVPALRIGVILPLGLSHPLYAAEDIAVLDLISSGRTMVVAYLPAAAGLPSATLRERFAEALEVCLGAWAPGPFRFEGRHFRVPANLPENGHAAALREISVTPKPAQPQIPLWVLATDLGAAGVASRLRLPLAGPAAASSRSLRTRFQRYWSAVGPRSASSLVLIIRDLSQLGADGARRELEGHRDAIGAGYVVCRLTQPGASDADWLSAVRRFGQGIIPQFRMFAYPPELRDSE